MDIAKEKKSFLLYKDNLSVLDDLSDEKAGILFKAIKEYQTNNTEMQIDDEVVRPIFRLFEASFIRDNKKYIETSKKNSENAKKRWRGENATASDRKQSNAINADSDSDKDSVSDTDKDKEKEKDFVKKDIGVLGEKEKKTLKDDFKVY